MALPFQPSALAVILASKGLGPYFRQHFLDKTFQGLYQVNAFDLALLIPYFIVLIILAGYGGHRYWLVYLYYKKRKNKTTDPPGFFDDLPRVTVQLPIFNEQYVVDRLLDAVCRLDYPREKLDIQLLDDSTDETTEVARLLVERYAAAGYPVVYLHRDNREGFKAGALEAGLKSATGEFVAIFDADFVPYSDFLLKCIHHFTDPKVGMVQPRSKPSCSTATLFSNIPAAPAAASFSTSTARQECGVARLSRKRAAGSTIHSPKTPIFPIARNSRAGNSSTCRMWNARPSCR